MLHCLVFQRAIYAICFQDALDQNVILHALPAEKKQGSKTVILKVQLGL